MDRIPSTSMSALPTTRKGSRSHELRPDSSSPLVWASCFRAAHPGWLRRAGSLLLNRMARYSMLMVSGSTDPAGRRVCGSSTGRIVGDPAFTITLSRTISPARCLPRSGKWRVSIRAIGDGAVNESRSVAERSRAGSAKICRSVRIARIPGGDLFRTLSDQSAAFAQNPNSRLGKLIFLEENDPFAGASVTRGGHAVRIIGNGIRRSGGAGAVNGQILLSDQGGSVEHEMTFFPPDARPLDFGWPGREGTQGIGNNPPASVNGPTIAYGFGSGVDQGTGIVLGGLYTGRAVTLNNSFVFGDTGGTIWSVPFSELTRGFLLRPEQMERRTADFVPDADKSNPRSQSSWTTWIDCSIWMPRRTFPS